MSKLISADSKLILTRVPLNTLIHSLTIPQLKMVAASHNISFVSRFSSSKLLHLLADHGCTACTEIYTVLAPCERTGQQQRKHRSALNAKHREKSRISKLKAAKFSATVGIKKARVASSTVTNLETKKVAFPPPPLTPSTEERIIRQACANIVPDKFIEAGCCTFSDFADVDMQLLHADGVTRAERFHVNDPIVGLPGPVVEDSCDSICKECAKALISNKRPLKSLANHMWIGRVPWQLKELTFAERMLIARVRYNRDEISEVLAFVFLGPTKPTEEEFMRTPHVKNIEALPEHSMPFCVDWKQTDGDESTLTPEQRSVDDGGVDTEGTSSGKCTFAVHGLTGDGYGSASIRTLKAKTLDHLANNGQTLGFGHSAEPQSMFKNVQLYPQMFPWLFPYGLGGIGHHEHRHRISEAAHKRFLLMYHDKRFQTDLYFPMVAFNELQIKAGKTGSHLLAKKNTLDLLLIGFHT
ncbi:hypothetical protein C8J57DRAFT_1236723 [Mycena rebaudengoi]|nr:hypothetical protein C8J57DRAFT_1236723 [Mycena rebaudengoi]